LQTVLFPDLALHCTPEIEFAPGSETVTRPPDLVIEILGKETAGRDRGPSGAKFRAYQASGVREYYYTWANGLEASGYRLENGLFVPCERDGQGFYSSQVLGGWLRLAPPEWKP
jgi:Uma2 family endonuclease